MLGGIGLNLDFVVTKWLQFFRDVKIAEGAEIYLLREVGRKTGNQVCTLSINLEFVIIVTLTEKCSNRLARNGLFKTKKAGPNSALPITISFGSASPNDLGKLSIHGRLCFSDKRAASGDPFPVGDWFWLDTYGAGTTSYGRIISLSSCSKDVAVKYMGRRYTLQPRSLLPAFNSDWPLGAPALPTASASRGSFLGLSKRPTEPAHPAVSARRGTAASSRCPRARRCGSARRRSPPCRTSS